MATASNRLPMTQVSFRRSFKSPQKDITELDTGGESGYEARSEDELSNVERLCLKNLVDDPTTKKLIQLDLLKEVRDTKAILERWPLFFNSKEESGIEAQQGLVTLWSNFLIVEALMASLSIQPLVMVPNIAHDWKLKLYGYMWTVSMIADFWGIGCTTLFLSYLLGCPNKATWKWACQVGWLMTMPSKLVYLDLILILATTTYTCWILYGYQIGIVCIVVEFLFSVINLKIAFILHDVQLKVTNKNMQ